MTRALSHAWVGFREDSHHLRPSVIGRYVRIGRKHFTLLRSGDRNAVFRIVRAGFGRRHSVALPAIERDVELQRLRVKRAVPQLVEGVLRIEGTVIAADAGMVAPDDKVRPAEARKSAV